MFQHIGAGAYKPGLETTYRMCEQLGNPQEKFKSIHIAGTNGKGSCSHLLASILQEKGYKTGLFTSPHLKDFRERIKVNGSMIGKNEVVSFMKNYEKEYAVFKPSFFELTFCMAMQHFRNKNVDIAIIETGMGGRLDSTNILNPILGIITNISYDHMMFLGDTLAKIAAEKAGIMKPGMPVIIGETQKETKRVFLAKAKATSGELVFADTCYEALKRESFVGKGLDMIVVSKQTGEALQLSCPLGGYYQLKNVQTVLAAVAELNKAGLRLSETAIQYGFRKVIRNTGFKGRWQVLSRKPLTVCDTAHNEAGIRYIAEQLAATPCNKLHIVFGMLEDKDSTKILKLLPPRATYYFCRPSIPRGRDAEMLRKQALAAGLNGKAYETVNMALSAARQHSGEDDLIFVGGSTFVVAEVV
ncbi:MAG: folylpolyglutamate synthase/dihydrofolate synthase family protein [Bacteroidota bacterium]